MKLPKNIQTAAVVGLSFLAVFLLFNLDTSGQITAVVTEYFPEKDTILSLCIIAFLVYGIVKGIRVRNTQSLKEKKETHIWYVLLLMTCSFTAVVLIATIFFS
jgi:hypothetical protein